MREALSRAGVIVAIAVLFCISPGAAAQTSPAGSWVGSIGVPGTPLAVAVTLRADAASAWTGTIDLPTQGAKGLALEQVVVSGRAVSFQIRGVPGAPAFKGELSEDGNRIAGTFTQNGATLTFSLERGVATRPNRPQEPKPPFPYRTEDVRYRNDTDGIQLAGTLTLPASAAPAPAVLLISGSGAQDRDETLFDHKPFLVIADHLTRAGFAVLRVDDRGVGGSDRGPATATTASFAGDVLAGVAYLKTRGEIDQKHIGLVGHSEGGIIAPMVAAKSKDVAFIVMLAGSGLPGDQVMLRQVEALAGAQGAPQMLIDWDRAMRDRVYQFAKAQTGAAPDAAKRQALIDGVPPIPGMADATAARSQAEALLNASLQPWFRFFLAYDPRPTLQQVTCPVLALGGSLDMQVDAAQNLPAIEAALKAGGNRDVTTMVVPGVNHLFQTAKTGATDEYGTIEETIAPSVLALVTDWLKKHQ